MRMQLLGRALLGWCVVASASLSAQPRQRTDTASDRALRFFERLAASNSGEVLRALRPAPLDANAREVVLAGLPSRGDLEPSSTEAEKLAQMKEVHEVELKCDGIGVLTLVALGLDPAPLGAAARKLTRYNEEVGAMGNAKEYPGLTERARFARDLVAARPRSNAPR